MLNRDIRIEFRIDYRYALLIILRLVVLGCLTLGFQKSWEKNKFIIYKNCCKKAKNNLS